MRPLYLFILLCMYACTDNSDANLVARVYDKDLFVKDLKKEIPSGIEDSSFYVQQYINTWVKKQLMIYHAEINLTSDMQDYKKQIADYKSSLLIYAYQQQLLNYNFDTLISNLSIYNYYNQYLNEFKLNNDVFQGRYIIVDKSAPKLRKLNDWYNSTDDNDYELLEDYCQQFAKDYYLLDTIWQYTKFIDNKIPIEINHNQIFLSRKKSTFFEDDKYRYYVYYKDYKIKGNISPLQIVYHKIYNVLLNKKKIEYLKNIEQELYQNALALQKIKIY